MVVSQGISIYSSSKSEGVVFPDCLVALQKGLGNRILLPGSAAVFFFFIIFVY